MSYRRRSHSRAENGFVAFVILFIIFFVGVLLYYLIYSPYMNNVPLQERVIQVCSKEPVAVEGGNNYRVYAVEDSFEITDSLLRQVRKRSADDYAKVMPGTRYRVVTKGARQGFGSFFPNILELEPIGTDGVYQACETAGLDTAQIPESLKTG